MDKMSFVSLENKFVMARFSESLIHVNKLVVNKKSRILETKHLLTDADSSTDTTVGWTKNTRKPNLFEKWKKSSKTQKLKKSRDMPILAIYPSTRGL